MVLVPGDDALQEGDRLLALSGPRRRRAALEREARAAVEVGGAGDLPELLVQSGRGLELARLLVRGGGPAFEAGPDVDAPRRGPALARLVGTGGLRHHPHRFVELGRAQVVAALDEPGRGLGGSVGLEGLLAPQGRGPHDVARLLEGDRGLLVVLRSQEQLGCLPGLPEAQERLGRLPVVAALGVRSDGPVELAGLLEEPSRLERALVLGGGSRRGVGRRERHVLHEVLLVGLGRLQRLAVLLPGFRGAQRIAALLVQLGRRGPLPREPEQPRRLEAVALLEEERRRARRLAGRREEGRPLLVVTGLKVELRRALGPAELLEGGRRRPVLPALHVGLGRLGQPARVFEQLACREVVVLFLEAGDLALELLLREARSQDPREEIRPARGDPGDAEAQAIREEAIAEEKGAETHDPGNVRVIEKVEEESHPSPVTLPASLRRSGISAGL